ncbi:hypothetical protein F4775DRAFT_598739 [Biscogniauxia sp. FL1348]|nr:hypothetical protein F4775DRAFT_598739 [Biscogniauxia sp. FL1348]
MTDYNQVPEGQQPGMDAFDGISLNTPADDGTTAHLHGPLVLQGASFGASEGLEERASSLQYDCICGAKFTRPDALRRHITCKSKSITGQYPCRFCNRHQGDKAFRRRDYLDQHLKVYHKVEITPEVREFVDLFIAAQPPVLSMPSGPNNVARDLDISNTGGIGQAGQVSSHYEQHPSAAYGLGMGLDYLSQQPAQYGIGYGPGSGMDYMNVQPQPTTLGPYQQQGMMYDPINGGTNYASVQQESFQNDIMYGYGAGMTDMNIDPQLYVGVNAANSMDPMNVGQQSFENDVDYEQYVDFEQYANH